MRTVPLARRNLFQDARRATLAVAGVAVALVLVLVLDGVFAGALRQVTAYLRNVPADVIVSQRGVHTMHMSASSLPDGTVGRVREMPGVAWAEGIRFTTATVRAGAERQLGYVIGYDTRTGRGGPWSMANGRAPVTGQAVLDEVAADALGVGVGDTVELLGRPFVISGLSEGGTSITNTMTFIPEQDFADVRGPSLSYLLVGAEPGVDGDGLARRIERAVPGVTVQSRDEFVDEEGLVVKDMSADIMQIMSIIAFAIALAVVALTLFTTTLSKLREYAVVKALGASSWRLARALFAQAAWSVALALILAVALSFGVAALVAMATPNVRLRIEAVAIARVAVAALVVGSLGALVPLRRITRLDPASAFRA
jgi:putative ABC transport system permease protein